MGEVVLTANSVTFHAPADSDDRTTFTYTIEDSNGGRGQATVYVTIVGDDPPPPAPAPPPVTPPTPSPTARSDQATMIEDDPPITIGILANDTSADGDVTDDTIIITGAPAAGTARSSDSNSATNRALTPLASTPSSTSCARQPARVTQRRSR